MLELSRKAPKVLGERVVRVCVDVAMALVFCAIMATPLIHDAAHEWLGMALFVLVVVHLRLNWHFVKSVAKGRWSARRVVLTAIDALLVVGVLALAASSIVLSSHVFSWLPAISGAVWARPMHMLCSHWMVVLTGAHIGMHLSTASTGDKHLSTTSARSKRAAFVVCLSGLAVFGLWSFCELGVWGYMTGAVPFFNASFDAPLLLRVAQYLGIGALFAWCAWVARSLIRYVKERKSK